MYKIEIYTVSKHKKGFLSEEVATLEKRLLGLVACEWRLFKKEEEMEKALLEGPPFILLDERGRMMSSIAFSKYLTPRLRTRFVIGGSEGVSEKIRQHAEEILSFSPMTFTHEHIRLLLMEQIYRAFSISKGTPYHK